MADVLDRINKLMALALNNPNEHEAKSAALAAVKAIRENKITLIQNRQPSPLPHNPYGWPSYKPTSVYEQDYWRQTQQQYQAPPPYEPPKQHTAEEWFKATYAGKEMSEEERQRIIKDINDAMAKGWPL